tara:strand:+ start:290 stop:571 length:282 start_codon:yes stop_codon:yes gene_type:complete
MYKLLTNTTQMKQFNLQRLMNASPYIEQISDTANNALFDYYIGIDISLNDINVDDDIINGITETTIEEFKEDYTNFDDVNILYMDEENIAFFN